MTVFGSFSEEGGVNAIAPGDGLDSFTSECGIDFDEYVQKALPKPFPYCNGGPSSRHITDLWNGRRLKLFSNNHWRVGTVSGWFQSTSGPFCRVTSWILQIEFDSLDIGDHVEIHGLRGDKQYNGRKGTITSYDDEQRRYGVTLTSSKKTTKALAVKPANIQTPLVLEFRVKRMNVVGGGTVHAIEGHSPTLLSLGWLEPALPSIDLQEGSSFANCPTCRSKEPPFAAYQEGTLTEIEQECPVCLEKKHCRLLKCKHLVCESCWTSWRYTSSGVPGRFGEKDLAQERSNRCEEYLGWLPQSLGGKLTSPEDAEETLRHEAIGRIHQYVASLIQDANSGEVGLARFRREVMVASIQEFFSDFPRTALLQNLPIAGIEILLQVVVDRQDELHLCFGYKPVHDTQVSQFLHLTTVECCLRIGEKYKEARNYRSAAPWYERALVHSQQSGLSQENLCAQYYTLGLAQKCAGFLTEALKSYNASLKLARIQGVVENRKTLLCEMEMWTGSSGKLTPGC